MPSRAKERSNINHRSCYSMKKILLLILSVVVFSFVSCGEKIDKKDKTILYAPTYKIYNAKDSTFSGIKVYVVNIDGHKAIYHVFSGKNKSQMEVWHMQDECKKKCGEKK
jgi:hypothetical protein